MSNDEIPKIGEHRGVPLDVDQSPARLEIVRQAIDWVFETGDAGELLRILCDLAWPPEARRFAGAKVQAVLAVAADRRETRPNIDPDYVKACLAGLDYLPWRDSEFYCSILDRRSMAAMTGTEPVRREKPLDP